MARIRICPECGAKNPAKVAVCIRCDEDISDVAPVEGEISEQKPLVSDEERRLLKPSAAPRPPEPDSEPAGADFEETQILSPLRLVQEKDEWVIPIPLAGGVLGREALGKKHLADNIFISRRHAEVRRSSGGWEICPRSKNTTLLNGRELANGECYELHHGDTITLADTDFKVRFE